MNGPIITLLTDFGIEDAYVAQMKGQILSLCPSAQLVDITHAIPPQDIAYGALVLAQAAASFPAGTIHVAVIDPGVGTDRKIIAVNAAVHSRASGSNRSTTTQRFVLPDNGLIGRIVTRCERFEANAVTDRRYWLPDVSATFHGRDIMAPVAAHWALGIDRHAFGPSIDDLILGSWEQARFGADLVEGEIIAIDHFGNAITNIALDNSRRLKAGAINVTVGGEGRDFQVVRTYGEQALGARVILIGSHDLLELAVVGRSAAHELGLQRGQKVSFPLG